jgi:hypothetical protein
LILATTRNQVSVTRRGAIISGVVETLFSPVLMALAN